MTVKAWPWIGTNQWIVVLQSFLLAVTIIMALTIAAVYKTIGLDILSVSSIFSR